MTATSLQVLPLRRVMARLDGRSSPTAAACGLVIASLSALVLVGWLSQTQSLAGVVPGAVTVKFNAAIGFLAVAVALVSASSTRSQTAQRIQLVAGGVAVAVGMLTLIAWTGAGFSIDQLFVTDTWTAASSPPGRPAITTALALVILGFAAMPFLDRGRTSVMRAALGASAIGISSAVIMVGVFSPGQVVADSVLEPAPMLASIAVLVSSIGLVVLSRLPLLDVFQRGGPIGMSARAGIAISVVLPVTLAALGSYAITVGLPPTTALASISTLGIVGGILFTTVNASRAARYQDEIDEAQAHLRMSEARSLAILDQIPDMIVTKDQNGVVTWVNDCFQRTMEVSREDAVGRPVEAHLPTSAFVALAEEERLAQVAGAAMSTSVVLEPDTQHARWLDVRILPLLAADGATNGVLEVFTDVTSARAGQVSADRLAAVVDSSNDAIFSVDMEGMVSSWNGAAERIFGASAAEVVGTSASGILSVDASGRAGPRDAADGHADGEMFGEWPTKDGRRLTVRMSAAPLRDQDGVRVGTSIIATDVTQAVAAQRDLEASEASLRRASQDLVRSNQSLQEFASVASHDLKEPLRKIRAFGDRLQRREGAGLSAESTADLSRIMNAAERMQALIADLLELARVSSAQRDLKSVPLAAVVADALDDLAERTTATHALIEVDDLPVMTVDAAQMRRVFMNLIGNALKFHASDTVPEIHIGMDDPSGDMDLGTDVRIWVQDHGVGFEQHFAQKVFSPFERLHGREEFEGTGMGLAICRQIVERHGGTIEATSEPGVGTRMTITLPRQPVQADLAEASS